MRTQIGNVSGLKVLDAGCGLGFLASYMIVQDASVTTFDVSPKMIDSCRVRTAGKAKFFLAGMSQNLEFARDSEFDLVVSSLAIDSKTGVSL